MKPKEFKRERKRVDAYEELDELIISIDESLEDIEKLANGSKKSGCSVEVKYGVTRHNLPYLDLTPQEVGRMLRAKLVAKRKAAVKKLENL